MGHDHNGDVVLVFDGGSKGNPGLGYGSYAIIINNEADIRRLEFGDGVTNNEAEYDTLIAALEMFVEEGSAANIKLPKFAATANWSSFRQTGRWKARDARKDAKISAS